MKSIIITERCLFGCFPSLMLSTIPLLNGPVIWQGAVKALNGFNMDSPSGTQGAINSSAIPLSSAHQPLPLPPLTPKSRGSGGVGGEEGPPPPALQLKHSAVHFPLRYPNL